VRHRVELSGDEIAELSRACRLVSELIEHGFGHYRMPENARAFEAAARRIEAAELSEGAPSNAAETIFGTPPAPPSGYAFTGLPQAPVGTLPDGYSMEVIVPRLGGSLVPVGHIAQDQSGWIARCWQFGNNTGVINATCDGLRAGHANQVDAAKWLIDHWVQHHGLLRPAAPPGRAPEPAPPPVTVVWNETNVPIGYEIHAAGIEALFVCGRCGESRWGSERQWLLRHCRERH
jgi:hypothetical protein